VSPGSAEIERLDIYRAGPKLAPIFIFIHGGAWRSGRSKDFAGPAEMFLAAGAHHVVPDFAWVQDVGGNLMVLADQVCRAVAWVYKNVARSAATPIGSTSVANRLVGILPRSR
jgi:arylformamidase